MATESRQFRLTVHYVNGLKQAFEGRAEIDLNRTASVVTDVLTAQSLVLQLDDRTLVIPYTSILYLEATPPLRRPPAHALNVAFLD